MQVLISMDREIPRGEDLRERIGREVGARLGRHAERITRLEAHLSAFGGGRARADSHRGLRCLLEARPAGLRPLAVSHEAATLPAALEGALEKLENALAHTLGRLAGADRAPPEEPVAALETLEAFERTARDARERAREGLR